MFRQLCIPLLFCSMVFTPLLHAGSPVPPPHALASDLEPHFLTEPEIDRSPIWAMVFGRYLYHLGREMFWPDLDQRASFKIGVVGWEALAEDLGHQLAGRSLAGIPVEIVPLTLASLRDHRGDFTMLFLGDTNLTSEKERLE